MPSVSVTERNQALDSTGWNYISLHTADPLDTGANEIAGGAYARQAVTWNAQSGGNRTNSNAISVPIPASTTASHFAVWSAASGGTYYIGGPLSPSISTVLAASVGFAAGSLSVGAQ